MLSVIIKSVKFKVRNQNSVAVDVAASVCFYSFKINLQNSGVVQKSKHIDH